MSMKMRFVLLGVASVLVVALWFFVAFKPAQGKLGDVKDQVASTQASVSELQTRLANLQALKADEEQLRKDAERLTKALPEKPALSDFIRLVQDAANDAGIDFITVTPSLPSTAATAPTVAAPTTSAAPTPAPSASADGTPANTAPVTPTSPLQAIAVSVSAEGTYFELENFMSKMEGLGRALRVDDFQLDTAGGTDTGAAAAPAGQEQGITPQSNPKLALQMKLQMFMLNKTVTGVTTAPVTGGTQ